LIEDSLCIALATFVVDGGIVMFAVEAAMQIRTAAITHIAKADGLSRRQRNLGLTGLALHAASVQQKEPGCHRIVVLLLSRRVDAFPMRRTRP
jgi:hypothetical protein